MAGADFVPRASLISTTVALGITPPCSSRTIPVIVPVVICASAADAASTHTIAAMAALVQILRISFLPLKKPAEVRNPVIDYTGSADYGTAGCGCLELCREK